MSYEPTVWQTGDVVTSQKLNKLEQDVADAGGGGGGVVPIKITITEDGGATVYTANMTALEIKTALQADSLIVLSNIVMNEGATIHQAFVLGNGLGDLMFVEVPGTGYILSCGEAVFGTEAPISLIAANPSDYPTATEGGE